jgi:hypothetical protein
MFRRFVRADADLSLLEAVPIARVEATNPVGAATDRDHRHASNKLWPKSPATIRNPTGLRLFPPDKAQFCAR